MKVENDDQNETEEPEIKRIRQGKSLYEEKTEISCMHFRLKFLIYLRIDRGRQLRLGYSYP